MKEKKIVLVEDDLDHATLIIDTLESENKKGVIVILKKDGQEAIDYFQKEVYGDNEDVRSCICLVILDLNLPKVGGIDVLKYLKKNSMYSFIPVVIFSTSSDDRTVTKAYDNGADSFITKPISYEEFVEKIQSLNKYC